MTDDPAGDEPPPGGSDPILARRARLKRLAEIGQRVGYSLFGLALILFFVGFAAGFPSWLITVIVACLVGGSIVLAPAIVIGYGVKAAVRDDAGLDSGH